MKLIAPGATNSVIFSMKSIYMEVNTANQYPLPEENRIKSSKALRIRPQEIPQQKPIT